MAGIACEHHAYRVYDPYYTDYHEWNNDEVVYYNRVGGRNPSRSPSRVPQASSAMSRKNIGHGATTMATTIAITTTTDHDQTLTHDQALSPAAA